MKRVALAVLVVACLLLLVACGHQPVSGTVIGKNHYRAHTETVMVPQYMTACSTNAQGIAVCTSRLMYFLPVDTYYPDKYSLTVHNTATDQIKKTNVSKDVYDATNIGAYFTNQKTKEN